MNYNDYKTKWRKERRQKLIQQFGGKCQHPNCNSTEQLEFAHINKTKLHGSGRGQDGRHKDITDNPTCYTLLCKTHHRGFDKNEKQKNRNL